MSVLRASAIQSEFSLGDGVVATLQYHRQRFLAPPKNRIRTSEKPWRTVYNEQQKSIKPISISSGAGEELWSSPFLSNTQVRTWHTCSDPCALLAVMLSLPWPCSEIHLVPSRQWGLVLPVMSFVKRGVFSSAQLRKMPDICSGPRQDRMPAQLKSLSGQVSINSNHPGIP